MARELELFNGTVLEFPDDTPDDVMVSAGRRETDRLRTEAARKPLPSGVDQSSAGAGRGRQGGATAQQMAAAAPKGGRRGEFKPFVAGTVQQKEAGAGRGNVNPDPVDTGVTLPQLVKDFRGGVEQVKALGTGAAAFAGSAVWNDANKTLAGFDAIDSGARPPAATPGGASQVFAYYHSASAEDKAQLKAEVAARLGKSQEFVNDSVRAIKAFSDEQQKLSGQLPEFTDVLAGKSGFGEWAIRNGVAASPTMIASMLSAVAGGMPGLMASGAAMATGDMTSARAKFASKTLDPTRFTSADRAADAAQAQPEATARYLADNVGRTAALAVPYAALDRLGPVATLAKQGVSGLASEGVKQFAKKGLKETGAEMVNEGGQEVVNIAGDMLANERPNRLTVEDAKRVGNAAAVGGLMGAGGHTANAGMAQARDAIGGGANQQIAQAIDQNADTWAKYFSRERAVAGKPEAPTQARAGSLRRFDELAAAFGLDPATADKVKQQAGSMPAGDVPGFLSRVTGALNKRGLFRKPIDDAGIQGLDDAMTRVDAPDQGEPMPSKTAVANSKPTPTPQALQADELIDDGSGLSEPSAPIDQAAHAAATSPQNDRPEPTEAQKAAGNYALGHHRIAGLGVSIENPQGSVRRGVDPDGKPWETPMKAHYGYFKGTTAKDGDKLDVFIKPGTQDDYSGPVFVIDQVDPRTGKLDEHKVVVGVDSEAEAEALYRSNYTKDWKGFGAITRLPQPAFRAWAENGNKRQPLGNISEYKPDVAVPAGQVAGARDGRGIDAARSGGIVGSDAVAPGRMDQPAESPEARGEPIAPVADAGQPNAALSDIEEVATKLDAQGGTGPTFARVLRSYADDLRTGKITAADVAPKLLAYREMAAKPVEAKKPEAPPAVAPVETSEPVQPIAINDRFMLDGKRYTVEKVGKSSFILKDAKGKTRVVSADSKAWKSAKPVPVTAKMIQRKSHPSTVWGSKLLAIVSHQLGGIDPMWRSEFSSKMETARMGKDGRKVTQWRDPLIPGVGRFFRAGGAQDFQRLAEVLEGAGYLEPGSVEADYKEAGERAKDMVKAALQKSEPQTLDQQIAEIQANDEANRLEWEREQEENRRLNEEEARLEREAIMAENGIIPDGMHLLDDGDLSAFEPGEVMTDEAVAEHLRNIDAQQSKEQEREAADDTEGKDSAAQRDVQQVGGDEPARPGSAVGDRTPDAGPEAQDILTAQTAEDLKAKAEREAAGAEAERKKKAAEQEQLRKAADAKENKARADATVDDFRLGQDAGQQMSGMGDMFAEPATPAADQNQIKKPRPEAKPNDATRAAEGDSEAERQAKADLLSGLGELAALLSRNTRANMLPEQEQALLPILTKVFDAAFRLGKIKFKDAANFVLTQIRQMVGDDVADMITLDHVQGAYISMAGKYREQGADRAVTVAAVESLADITDNAQQEAANVPSANPDLERNRGNADAEASAVEGSVPAEDRADAGGFVAGGEPTFDAGGRQPSDQGLRADGAAADGERGDQQMDRADGGEQSSLFAPRIDVDPRGGGLGDGRVPPAAQPGAEAGGAAGRGLQLVGKRLEQSRAQSIKPIPGDLANIREALPFLLPGQQEDTKKAEDRFAKADGYGMLFTNGTGTGKTYTGLGVIKRFERQGKTNTLIIVPSDKIAEDWVRSGKDLMLDITRLSDTKTAGKGIVITTYAALGMNEALAARNWDLVVPDEAHYLMQEKDGTLTNALSNLRAITLHPAGANTRAAMLHADLLNKAKALSEEARLARTSDDEREWARAVEVEKRESAAWRAFEAASDAVKADVEARQGEKRTRVAFLSATPFAYDKTIDWANGYLFDYGDGQTGQNLASGSGFNHGYNSGDWREQFFMQHLGWRMRYNKLTEPDAKVDRGLLQRQFNAYLKKGGSLSGRMLDVDADYDRRFALVDSAIGRQIDEALDWLRDHKVPGRRKLAEAIDERFDYLSRRYLLEAIKAEEAIPLVKEHLAAGRKVVVFHDYKKGGGFHPFDIDVAKDATATVYMGGEGGGRMEQQSVALGPIYDEFKAKFKDLMAYPFRSMRSPIGAFRAEFPDVLLFNGDVSPKQRRAAVERFQDDDSGPQVFLAQTDAAKVGISLHDTTGKHQRVLINLGQPTQPTTAIQQEGRIYRTGQATDAIIRYLNTGTNWERWAFATTIATRSSHAENLGMGEMARALKDSFIAAFEESDTYPAGHEGEGKGGKARDRLANEALSEYDRAKAFYWGTQKKNSRTKAEEGTDYFATPEPLGLKMVQWLDMRPGDAGLEPSGGHGAIARWFGETTKRTAIEPSGKLAARLALVFDGEIRSHTFEELNVINKFDGIAMNPPFGTAGRTAIDHLAKAATHLREGGRIVALIPTGPAADKKFDKWFYEEGVKPSRALFNHERLGAIHEGDTLTAGDALGGLKISVGHVDKHPDGRITVRPKGEAVKSGVSLQYIESVKAGPRTETYKPAEGLHLVAEIKLPGVTFERAGTGVMTRVVVIEKPGKDQDAPQQITRDYSDIADINELFDRLEELDLKPRAKPAEVEPEAPADTARAQKEQQRAEKATASLTGEALAKENGLTVVEHTTAKGKVIKGVIRSDLTKEQAQQVDPYTWKKDGGYFIRLEHLSKLLEKFPNGEDGAAINKEMGAFVSELKTREDDAGNVAVYEPAAPAYTGAYETDLFGNALPDRARPNETRVSRDVQPAATVSGDTAAPAGQYNVRTTVGIAAKRKLGARVIRTPADAAAATGYLYKSAVERFDGIVTNKDGKPLAVIGGFKGALSQASVYPATLVGEAVRIPGAAFVWFSHNHPSGASTLSRADEMLGDMLGRVFAGSGIESKGILAVGGGGYSFARGGLAESGAIKPRAVGITVPAIERELAGGQPGPSIGSPQIAKALAKAYYDQAGEPGLLLLNSQNQVAAWVPVPAALIGPLKDTGGLNAIYRAVSEANAGAVIIVHGGELDAAIKNKFGGPGGVAALNIGAALSQIDVRVLDIINAKNGKSAAEVGDDLTQPTVFSRHPGRGVAVADAEAAIAAIREALPNAPQIVVHEKVANAPKSLRDSIRAAGAENDVEAAYHEGKIHVFPVHIDSIERLQFVVAKHEIRHHGLRSILGPKLQPMMMGLYLRNAKMRAAADAQIAAGKAKTKVLAVEEALADMAPEDVASLSGFDRLVSAIRQWLRNTSAKLRKAGLSRVADMIEPNGWTDRDVVALVLRAENVSRNGGANFTSAGTVFGREDNPAWYSELARQIQGSPMNAGSASAWAQYMDSLTKRGVKPDEIEWSGIREWLAMQPGKVYKAQVLEYLEGNGVKVEETVLGETGLNVAGELRVAETDSGEWGIEDTDTNEFIGGYYESEEKARKALDEMTSDEPTKYASYTLPGGENYREVLLTLPPKERKRKLSLDEVNRARANVSRRLAPLTAQQYAEMDANGEVPVELRDIQTYKSNHWDQPNILAHIRLNDRVDADGKRVLFVEEIQSDWAQEGKKRGFKSPAKPIQVFNKETGAVVADFADEVDAARDVIARGEDRFDWRDAEGKTPAAPFVTATDKWLTLALKRVIKLAVDEGYDKVAFVTGEQSAERYDLSKQITSLAVYRDGAGFKVSFEAISGGTQPARAVKDADELADTIGKDLAQKAIADLGERRSMVNYSGLDLKVGGEGMRAFYDSIVPAATKALLKKMGGGQIESVGINTAQNLADTPDNQMVKINATSDGRFRVGVGAGEDRRAETFGTHEQAQAWADEQVAAALSGRMSKQPGFKVSDAMRDKARGGMALFSRHTPGQKAFLDKAGMPASATFAQRAMGAIDAMRAATSKQAAAALGREFRQGALDQFAGIDNAVKETLGNLPAEQDPYVAARLANGGASSVMRGLLLHGQARWAGNGQHLEKIDGTEGLLDILRPLGDNLNDFFGWMIANRANRLLAEGRERNFTAADIAAGQALADTPEKVAAFKLAANKFAAFKRSVLDVAEGAGLIDAEGRKVWDNADWIPFYRQVDGQSLFSPTGKKGMAGQSSGIRMLKGGEAALNDPLENILMNFSRLIDASLKNNAIRKTIDALDGSDLFTKVGYDFSAQVVPKSQVEKVLQDAGTPPDLMDLIPEEAFEGMAKLWAIRPPQDPDIVRVMVGGKPQFYRVNEPYLLRALTSFVPFDFPGLSVARLAKRVLTSMVTATPDFMLRNFVRDTMATKMIDRGELGAGVRLSDSIKGMGKAYMESGAGETMLFAGASFQGGHINGADPADTGRSIRRALRAKGFKASSVDEFMSSVLDTPVRFFEKYREIGDAVENANREAIFESVTRAGGSETAAAFQSKDLMDFSLRGSWAAYNFFADVVPFLNPRVQGLYRLGRANPKRVATYGLTMAAFAVLYAMAHAGDDRYERLPDWEKDGFWHFWVGGQHLRVPKPFELGLIFSTIPERMTRLMIGQDSAKKFAARMWAGTTDTLAFDPTPQLIKPAIEAFVSKRNSFFDTPIENDRDKGLPASVRADARTSDTMRVAVKAANVQLPILDKGAMDAMDISPKKMEHLVRGYLGTVGMYALGMVDSAVRMIEGHPPRPQLRMDEYPVVGVFMRVDPPKATVFQSDLYRIKEEVDKVHREYTKMLKDANGDRAKIEESRRFLAQNAAAINARPALVRGAEELGKLRKERDSIYLDPAMAPAAKRDRLDQVYQRQADVAQTIMLMPQVKAIR